MDILKPLAPIMYLISMKLLGGISTFFIKLFYLTKINAYMLLLKECTSKSFHKPGSMKKKKKQLLNVMKGILASDQRDSLVKKKKVILLAKEIYFTQSKIKLLRMQYRVRTQSV